MVRTVDPAASNDLQFAKSRADRPLAGYRSACAVVRLHRVWASGQGAAL